MECGACGAHYATDGLGAHDRDLTGILEKKLHEGGEAIGRFATTVGEKLTDLSAKVVDCPMPRRPARPEPVARSRDHDDDDGLSPDDRAALEELDDLEMKFRALEAEEKKKRGG